MADEPKLPGQVVQGPGSHRGGRNRLASENSPYLLQHAGNPVDWRPWDREAFETAKREDKPIFLSIGYSTCHWCHVMERETFENETAAALMNDAFVCIKVDREERPDIDHIYMTACQMMTGGGGWPLSVIMTPDGKPFFAGTYIPRETRYSKLGMIDLSLGVKELWKTRREEVIASANKVVRAMKNAPGEAPGETPDEATLAQGYEQLAERYDSEHGGFTAAPKFPTAHNLLFLLRYWNRTGDGNALAMVEKTLSAMSMGGMWDHVGFGFHRYSTDEKWLVPHFEKMLYDQAMLAMTYTEAYQATGSEEYARTAQDIFTYVLRDMRDSAGGFLSAEDADSEGEEGKFYVWKLSEIKEALGETDGKLFARLFNVFPEGNFNDEASGELTGCNILHFSKGLSQTAQEMAISEEDLHLRLEDWRSKMFKRRETRVRPHLDDKVLADWNGLMIAALSIGAKVFDREDYAKAATAAADFVLSTMRGADGRLLRRYRDSAPGISACLDDYAFFVWGLLELYEATFDISRLQDAIELTEEMIAHFWDDIGGGFYFTPKDGEDLLMRRKEIYDGATPSGNSVAAMNLLRLARMTGRFDFERRAEAIGRAFSGVIRQFPSAYTQFLAALEFGLGPSSEVVVVGDPDSDDTILMFKRLRRPFLPGKVVVHRPIGKGSQRVDKIAEYTSNQRSIQGKATAYVCRDFSCELPTTDPEKMLELLGVTRH
jgi:hypothetical protein